MKNIKWFTCACLLGCGLAFLPACSDDEEASVNPVFPEQVQTLTFASEGEQELAFTTNADWILSSSRLWCKFKQDGEDVQTLIGMAGEQAVTVVVDDDLWGIEEAEAELTLTMGGQSKVIAKVTRGARGLVIEGLDKITVAYSVSDVATTVTVKANFDWELTAENLPAWMDAGELPRKGYAGRAYNVPMSVKEEYIPYAQTEGTVTFVQSGTENKVQVPAEYAGMPDEAIEIKSPKNAYGWTVSADGASYSQGSLAGEDTEEFPFPMDIEVITKENQYEVVRFADTGNGLMSPNPYLGTDFFQVENKGDGHVTMEAPDANDGAARDGYVLVVPKAVYDKLSSPDDMVDAESGYTDFLPEYQRYIVFSFTQEAGNVASGGFIVKLQGWQDVECHPADDTVAEYVEIVQGATGVTQENIYYAKVSPSYYQVCPQLTAEQWDGSSQGKKGIFVMDFEGGDYLEGWNVGMVDNNYSLDGMVEKTMFISFSDLSQGWPMPAKALIFIVEE